MAVMSLFIMISCMMIGQATARTNAFNVIRLVGGSGKHEGRVEVNNNGTWGTICDENWGRQEAIAVCRQLGYSTAGAIAKGGAFFGPGTGPVMFDDVNCIGQHYFRGCDNACSVRDGCDHSKDASVTCRLQYQLVGGSGPHEGRVQIYYDRKRGTVCDAGWGQEEAEVLCGQLGYDPAGAEVKPGAFFGQISRSMPIHLDKVNCQGTESSIEECDHTDFGVATCNQSNYVSVICQPTKFRLVNGAGQTEGRVEVYHNNQWGTVCDTGFNRNTAAAICREVGFSRLSSNAYTYYLNAHFGQGTGPIWLDNMYCGSWPYSFYQCTHSCWGNVGCGHTDDVSVSCGIDTRLVGGSGPHEGRLEVYYKKQWGSVCDASVGPEVASVVCKELGYQGEGAIVRGGAHFGQGIGPIWVDEIDCKGSESLLAKCNLIGLGQASCGHNNDVSIVCKPTKYRLVGGSGPREGRVEVLINNIWGTVCDRGWGKLHARVVCNELGFPGTRAVAYNGAFFGEGTGPIWLDNVKCTGSEKSLSRCGHTAWGVTTCKHNGDVSVICRPSVRLVRGLVANKGRLEYFKESYNDVNEWGTVCDDGFGSEEAAVVCRELGYPTDGAKSKDAAFFGEGTGKILLDDVVCTGSEPTITSCTSTTNTRSCIHKDDVSVICLGDADLYVNPTVSVTLEANDIEFRKMYRFYCDFPELDDTLFYRSAWYVDGVNVRDSAVVKGDHSDLRESLSLTEDQLGRTVGYDLQCKIFVSKLQNAKATASSSKQRYIGIKILTPTITIKEGETGQIRIRATAEIGCQDEIFGCQYGVAAIIPDANTACTGSATVRNNCGVDILEHGWDREYFISVTADISMQYGSNSRQFEVTLTTPGYLDHLTWNDYTLTPKVKVIVVKDTRPTQSLMCKAYCDPRLVTFNNLNLNLNYPGTYTLYYDRENDIEVQIQTATCRGPAYCNCGMIARVGGTAYMISNCNSQNWIVEYVMCDDGVDVLKVERHGDYVITFPTGTVVKVHFISNNRFVNVYVFPSVLDVDKPRGLCGKITEDMSQHLVLRNNALTPDIIQYNGPYYQDAEEFVSSWRVTAAKNLFNPDVRASLTTSLTTSAVTCRCTNTINGQLSGILTCNADTPVEVCQANPKYNPVSRRTCAGHHLSRKRRSVTAYVHQEPSNIRIKRAAAWSGIWTEVTATKFCDNLFNSSAMYILCKKNVLALSVKGAIEACKEDIKLTGSTDFAEAALESVKSHCVREVYMDPALQMESGTEPSVFVQVVALDCPSNCSSHGACIEGTCRCATGYLEPDCAVNLNSPPAAVELEYNGLCDLKKSNCTESAFFGRYFTDKAVLSCRVTPFQLSSSGAMTVVSEPGTFTAEVESLSEVICPLPNYEVVDAAVPLIQDTFTGFKLAVSYGATYSQQLSMVVYNSECMNCSNTNGAISCQIAANYCVTNNKCYKNNESYPLDNKYICKADGNGGRWEVNGTDPNGPCSTFIAFPNSATRLTSNVVAGTMVNDRYLYDGWYGEAGKVIPTAVPKQNYCGTRFPIYLQGSPSKVLKQKQNITACIRRYSNLCIARIDVQVMFCGGDLFVYNLKSSPFESSGYCLEPRK